MITALILKKTADFLCNLQFKSGLSLFEVQLLIFDKQRVKVRLKKILLSKETAVLSSQQCKIVLRWETPVF